MPMTRTKKEAHLAELTATLSTARGVVFANYQGMKVKELEELRKKLRAEGMQLRVTKNRLLALALRRRGVVIDSTILDAPLAMAGSATDEIAAAKLFQAYQKEIETLKIAGGLLGDQYLTAADVKALAALPSRDELRAQLVGVLASPLTGLVRTLKAPLAGLVTVLKQYQEKQA